MELLESVSLSILKEKSKDIRIFLFLSLAYLYKENWEGFCDIFDGLVQLVESNYDSLFPDRDNAKKMAFKWLSESRFADVLRNKNPDKKAGEHILRLFASLDKLKKLLNNRFSEKSPFPEEFYSVVGRWKEKIVDKTDVLIQEKIKENEKSIKISDSLTQSDLQKKGNIQLDPDAAQKTVKRLARFLVNKYPQKVSGYRLIRNNRWDQLENIQFSSDGKTLFEGPSSQLRTRFQFLMTQKSWAVLIQETETTFVSGYNHLWLDLQRFAVTACQGLGKSYDNVGAAIFHDSLFLIRRLPDLLKMKFIDETPFCDILTCGWLSSKDSFTDVSKFESEKSGSREIESKIVDELVETEDREKTISELQKSILTSVNEKERFVKTMDLGTFFIMIDKPYMAVSVLEILDRKIEEFNLICWDPGLAVDAWFALVKAYKAAGDLDSRYEKLMDKICQVDPLKAYLFLKQNGRG